MKTPTRIMVVDDDPGVLQLFVKVLRAEGYEVLEASSGLQAIEKTHQFHPHLVLLDINLPDLNGIEVCKRIKGDKSLPDVFVALVSGEATSATDKAGGLEIGADDYVTKPVDVAEFRARVRTFVRLHNTTAALRAREQHYRQLMEILPDAVAVVDLQNRLTTVNAKAVCMFGYADTTELLKKTAFDLIPPEENDRLRMAVAKTLNDKANGNDEYTMIRKDGERFPAELRTVVLKDEIARPLGLVMVVRDITERKLSEKAFRESEARKSAIMQSAPDAIVTIDHQGKIVDCNSAAEKIFSESPRTVMGQEMAAVIIPPASRDWFRRGLDDSFRGNAGPPLGSRTETIALRADGTEFPIELTITPIELAEPPMFTAFIRDISGRRRSEEQIHLLAYAVQTTRELICITNRENRFTFVNQAFLDACGYDAHEVL
ncbi:MAG TPA: PAS domain S-box protein, partial [Verrucomicrobiae bacterium]|nr:PAS domain S-box protein [Verrucomicrobiae bacterium]